VNKIRETAGFFQPKISISNLMVFDEEKYELFLKINNDLTEEAISFLQHSRTLNINSSLNHFEWKPIHIAAYKGNTWLVQYLLDNGADIFAVNGSGYTPLMLAESKQHTNVVEILQNYVPLVDKAYCLKV